ncbi:MAG: PHP domain-containing protein [Planctomycetes bacterium]|nr:PHP domain-containing protein [Planctomycetota bacterium]
MERIRPEKLQAVRETIEALKSQRREVGLSSGYDDVRSLLHVHSAFSHDSRGTIEEIVAAAKEAGVRAIMFSEHPSNDYNYFLDGHRGFKQGVLLIPGAETEGFLAYPRQSIQDQKTDTPQAFSDLVRSTGGLIFLSHLEERMDWEIANITGAEIYNTHADFKEETRFLAALRSPLTMFSLVGAVKQYPQEVFGALLDYPADYLKRYDQLCQQGRHTGVAANDAHHNQAYRVKIVDNGAVLVEDALGAQIARLAPEKFAPIKLLTAGRKPGDLIFELDLDPYVRSFRHVSTHLLLTEVNEAQVWQALGSGRAYVAFDWIADPTGFVYRADRGADNWPVGSEVSFAEGLHLRAEAPLEGRFKLVRDGEVILDQSGPALDFPVDKPGVYRVEVWLNLAGEDRPWILTNPIYVRAKK